MRLLSNSGETAIRITCRSVVSVHLGSGEIVEERRTTDGVINKVRRRMLLLCLAWKDGNLTDVSGYFVQYPEDR
jgi:hypothetical protein